MEAPFLVGFVILAAVAAVGYSAERWSWAKPVAVLATIAAIVAAAAQLLR